MILIHGMIRNFQLKVKLSKIIFAPKKYGIAGANVGK